MEDKLLIDFWLSKKFTDLTNENAITLKAELNTIENRREKGDKENGENSQKFLRNFEKL